MVPAEPLQPAATIAGIWFLLITVANIEACLNSLARAVGQMTASINAAR